MNTTIGVFGLFDVASQWGMEKHNEDFGQTLAVWGVDSGPYLVVPFLGPKTVRDGATIAVDYYADVKQVVMPDPEVRIPATIVKYVDVRAQLLPAEKILEQAALDKYEYLRSAYLQRRRNLIYDGKPPREEIPED